MKQCQLKYLPFLAHPTYPHLLSPIFSPPSPPPSPFSSSVRITEVLPPCCPSHRPQWGETRRGREALRGSLLHSSFALGTLLAPLLGSGPQPVKEMCSPCGFYLWIIIFNKIYLRLQVRNLKLCFKVTTSYFKIGKGPCKVVDNKVV